MVLHTFKSSSEKQKQEDPCEFPARLVYMVRSRKARVM